MKTTFPLPVSTRPAAVAGPARSGLPRSRAKFLPSPLDPASQELERDADATMMVDKRHAYAGQPPAPALS